LHRTFPACSAPDRSAHELAAEQQWGLVNFAPVLRFAERARESVNSSASSAAAEQRPWLAELQVRAQSPAE